MIEEDTICPYPGLRSFTEEESLYFKGREQHIQKVTSQLEEKKFLMVTGASGDGKSSLILAGLIPQARAGFFKTKYSNWHVADFRPERSPLSNMARALASALRLEDPGPVEMELSRGFSSLVELYKSSELYLDEGGETWKHGSDQEKGNMERKAGNLLILVDQFEEFFTNPENFPGGVPSQESRLLLNIILETIKISLKDDLPIYVVCTMRSDYIGQCAAFRGLPEFIGFSQFFVPHLQRKELYQVIYEPAILSGNRISNRLIDRLIFDLEDGADQLPILQHALKQIWKAADHGRQEMDLIHYAMVGGMPGDKLPKEAIGTFQAWRQTVTEYERKNLEQPGLSNVLDIHANKLYEEAAAYCNGRGHPEITAKQAKFIIAMAYACLTRIDESRAVRNRMTLEEITQIINVPQFDTEVVGLVLGIFREGENTLLRPFIHAEDSSGALLPSAVIDITHEALIRNWKLLKKWSDQEYAYYLSFQDLQQQINRWVYHGKSDDFLLPIGPLTYFENWYKDCRPNQYWINRYNNQESDARTKLNQSAAILNNCRDFLRKSALRLFVTRTFMKYGAGRIGAGAVLAIILFLGAFFVYQWRIQKNDHVLDYIMASGPSLLMDKESTPYQKARFTVEADRLQPGYYMDAIQLLPGQGKIDLTLNTYLTIAQTDLHCNPPILRQSLLWADSLIGASGSRLDSTNSIALNQNLNNLNDLVRNQSYFLSFRPDQQVEVQRNRNVRAQLALVIKILAGATRDKKINMKGVHIAMTDALNHQGIQLGEIAALLNSISPLANNAKARSRFETWFPAQEKILDIDGGYFAHNGGYQMLAYFYAATGKVPEVLRCLDSLKKFNANHDQVVTNSTQITAYFLLYGQSNVLPDFVAQYAKGLGIPAHVYFKEILNRVGVMDNASQTKFNSRGNFNDVLQWLDESRVTELFSAAKEMSRRELKVGDDLNYNLALLNKHEGVIVAGKTYRWGKHCKEKADSLFKVSLGYYEKLSSGFREEKVQIVAQTGIGSIEKQTLPRKDLFLFPDHFKTSELSIVPGLSNFYGDSFFKFMIREKLFSKFYRNREDYGQIITWINRYYLASAFTNARSFLDYPFLHNNTFLTLDSLISQSGYDLDDAWIKLTLIENYFTAGDTANAYRLSGKLTFRQFVKANLFEEGLAFHHNKIVVARELAARGKREMSIRLVRLFANTRNRVEAYAKLSSWCRLNNKPKEADLYGDSAAMELSRVRNFQSDFFDFRIPIIEMFTLQNDEAGRIQAMENLGTMAAFHRVIGVENMVWAYARLNEYNKALRSVPELANAVDRLNMYSFILMRENIRRGNDHGEWKRYYDVNKVQSDYTFFQNDLAEN